MKENVGVLLAVSSLPGNHGIGDFGENSYKFIDWLVKHNYKYWQVLPLNPLGPGYSPYMSTCSEALETRYISLDMLVKEGLLKRVPKYRPCAGKVDFQKVEEFKEKYLRIAFKNYKKGTSKQFDKFKKNNPWVIPYSVFIVFRRLNWLRSWNTWPIEQITYFDNNSGYPKGYEDECDFHAFMQMIAYKQWNKVWAYARKKKITIIADCPFYVGIDSTDCWLHKEQFLFDEKYNPTMVSGVPPDCFSEDGQLWGTPIYDFEKMKQDNYSFLVNRIGYLATTCDQLRLDHFRAWDTYCVIPGGDINARRGEWKVGPRYDFFNALYAKYPNIKLIAEDLGDLFQGVHDLRDYYKLPGMFIMEFCIFDVNAHSKETQLVYTGTHDNQTLKGWLKSLPEENISFLKNKFPHSKSLLKDVFEYTWNVPSYMTIFPLQDLLGLDDRARMNYPGTVGSPNWEWKLRDMSWINKIRFGNK